MKLAITGAGGFLGTEILRQLSAYSDVTVYAFTRAREKPASSFHSATIFPLDNAETDTFDWAAVDVVIHCAFPRDTDAAQFASGLNFNERIYEFASAAGTDFIHISSQSVYDAKRREPATETTPVVLTSPYAVGKYMSELAVNSHFAHTRHTNLRMASLIGAGFAPRITNRFAAKIIAGEPLEIIGGNQQFGYLDVRDAAAGILRLAFGREDWAPIYHLGTSRVYTLTELAETAGKVAREFGYTPHITYRNDAAAWQSSALNCDLFSDTFSWRPAYDLEDTYRAIFQDLQHDCEGKNNVEN